MLYSAIDTKANALNDRNYLPNIECVVIDNFYQDPYAIRKKAFDYDFAKPDYITGWRTKQGYLPRNIHSLIRRTLGRPIKEIEQPAGWIYDNGTFFLSFADGQKKEHPRPHYDEPYNHHVCLIYLSENVPHDCGTSFFMHKRTGLESRPTRKDLYRLGLTRSESEAMLERDYCYPARWIETSRVSYKFNRAIIFPCSRFHAATRHFGDSIKNGRIYHLFTFRL